MSLKLGKNGLLILCLRDPNLGAWTDCVKDAVLHVVCGSVYF